MLKLSENILNKEDYKLLIEICDDWGFEYSLKNTSWEVEEMKKKLEKIYRDTFKV